MHWTYVQGMTVDHNLLCFFFHLERQIPVYNILNVSPCQRVGQEQQQVQEQLTTWLTKWLALREQKQINSFVKNNSNLLRAALDYVKPSLTVAQ